MMKTTKVIFEGSSNGGNFSIRYPVASDAEAMCRYINELSQEKTFILFQGEKVTLEDEQNYLQSQLEKIESRSAVLLLAVAGEQIIGISGIEAKTRVERHIASFGISVAREWRGLGIGKQLMELVLDEARIQLPATEIVTLGAFANNPTAIRMYENFGFQECGRLPRGIIHRGEYVDHVDMYRKLR